MTAGRDNTLSDAVRRVEDIELKLRDVLTLADLEHELAGELQIEPDTDMSRERERVCAIQAAIMTLARESRAELANLRESLLGVADR